MANQLNYIAILIKLNERKIVMHAIIWKRIYMYGDI